jgi:hypothetical protein
MDFIEHGYSTFTSLNGLLIKAELWFYLVYPPHIKISERKRTFAKLFS